MKVVDLPFQDSLPELLQSSTEYTAFVMEFKKNLYYPFFLKNYPLLKKHLARNFLESKIMS